MLAKFSVKKPFTVFVCVILIIILGIVSFMNMTPDLLPNMEFPYVMIMTTYPGASPEKVETVVTKPLEQLLSSLENLETVSSTSSENYSMIMLTFSDSANMDVVTIDIRDAISQVSGYWDDYVGTPYVLKISPDLLPTVVAAVSYEGMDTLELSSFTKDTILSKLEGISGVASVSTSGIVTADINVFISQLKIDEINDEINRAIQSRLSSAKRDLNSGREQLVSTQNQLLDQKTKINEQSETIAAGLTKLKQLKSTLDDLYAKRDSLYPIVKDLLLVADDQNPHLTTTNEYKATLTQIGMIEASLPSFGFADYTALSDAISQAEAGISQMEAGVSQIDSGVNKINENLSMIDNALKQLNSTGKIDLGEMISMDVISALLTAQNFSMPAGYITEEGVQYLIRVGDEFKDIDEIENMLLFDMGIDGVDPIRLSDVADVIVTDNSSKIYSKINGENGVLLSFTKQSNYATATVADNIADKFEELENTYEGLAFTPLMDQGDYIHLVIDAVLENLLIGGILAILILWLFLKDIRPTIIIAFSIPVSVTFAIVLMYFSGISLNIISLSGLAVGVGMLVDNSIVVIENIYRLRDNGVPVIKAAVSGAVQVTGAITASTLTTVCVFLPIVFISGITKQLFTDMALTIAYSLLASLAIALTLVPAMASGIFKNISSKESKGYTKFTNSYKSLLLKVLDKKAFVLIGVTALLIISLLMSIAKGFIFMPGMESTEISLNVTMPEDSTIEDTAYVCDTLSSRLTTLEDVETVGAMLSGGMSSIIGLGGNSSSSSDSATIYIVLSSKRTMSTSEITTAIEDMASDLDCEISISSSSSMGLTSLSVLSGSGITMNIYSDDLDELQRVSELIAKTIGQVEGISTVSYGEDNRTPELRITVNKDAAMQKGLTVAQVYVAVASAISSTSAATDIKIDTNSYSVTVTDEKSSNITREELSDLKIAYSTAGGESGEVALSEIAEITETMSLDSIRRNEQRRYVTVSATLAEGYNVTLVTAQVQEAINNISSELNNVSFEYSGENETIMESLYDLLKMLALGVVIVYLIMVAQFQSLLSPFIVMFTIPLAFTGGLLSLLLFNMNISVISMIGFVMLVGIIVNNGIVLVDYINQLREGGMPKREAIIESCITRLRPVLMTALTTVLGLLPMALAIGMGSDLIQPVAIVCIGGLIYATLMTLFVVPVMYELLYRKEMRVVSEEDLIISDL